MNYGRDFALYVRVFPPSLRQRAPTYLDILRDLGGGGRLLKPRQTHAEPSARKKQNKINDRQEMKDCDSVLVVQYLRVREYHDEYVVGRFRSLRQTDPLTKCSGGSKRAHHISS